MKHHRSMCVVLALLLVFTGIGYSQAVNGSLLGSILDITGARMPSVKVTVTESNTGLSRSTESNQSGNYSFPDLQPGTYTISAEQTGFKRASRADVSVIVNTSPRVDLTLEPGNVTETVTVTGEVPLLQTDRADTGRTIETKTLEDLPVGAGRNFQSFVKLVPGATSPFRPHSEFFNPQNSLSTQVNGQSRLGNNLQFEGVDNNERTGLLQVLIPPLEAIQTVDVSTSNFEAELGRATGAVTNVILKSGTNQFHGQAYWFNRVSALSARNFYDSARGHFVYNYLGGNIGGPIIKNRTFFFGDYLRITDHRYNPDRYTLPTGAQRIGDLSSSTSTIYDPNTGNPDGSARIPFAGNQIPVSRISGLSQKILSLVPLPNLPGLTNNYFTLIPFVRATDQFDVKVDHSQSEKDRFSVRYSFSRPKTFDGPAFGEAGGPHGGGFQGTGVQNTHNGAISYNRIFSPTLITQVRFGVSRYRNDAQQVDYGKKDSLVPGVNVDDFTSGQVGIDIPSYSSPLIGYSASLPWVRAESNVDFVNSWTKIKGNHTIKFGIDVRRIRDDLRQTQTYSPRGRYSYGNSTTSISGAATSFGNNLAGFLLDLPTSVGRDLLIGTPAYRAWETFAFVQDKWTVTPKLTVDFGVRWEFYPPGTPASKGGFSNYDPSTNSLVVAGIGSNPSNLGLDKHYKDFAPRVGMAYRLNEKTVLRSGFGISYSPFPDNTYAYNFPVKQNNAYAGNCSFCPAVLPNGQVAKLETGFPTPSFVNIPANGILANADVNQVYEVINKHFREPYVESWNAAIQRSLPFNLALDVAYVANHGVAQPANVNLNASTTIGGDVASQPLFALYKRKVDTNLRYVGFSSSYNSLQVKLDKRFSGGLAMTTAFTWSHALGYQSEDAGLSFYINGGRNWRTLDFNRKFNFVQSYVYELPFGKGRKFLTSGPLGYIVGGWQLNGILTIASGSPLNFGGDSAGLKAPGNSNTLNHFGAIPILKGNGRDASWFDATKCGAGVTTGCFAQPDSLQFGNLSPNVINGPGYWNLDGSVFRSFKVTERFVLEVRGEAFSAVNTPQWNNPDTGFGNKTFGFITGAGGNRQIQLGTKITF